MKKIAAALALAFTAGAAHAETRSILFVGNSFTYTRPPALQYNAGNVVDLTYPYYLATPSDNDPALPQPYGGVAGIFEVLATQAGLDYEVHHSLRGGATLRGHYLNTNPVGWDLRINLTKRAWDVVVLQGNSTEAIATTNPDLWQFGVYVDKIEKYVHVGAAESFRERQYSPTASNALRTIPANPNPSPNAKVYLYQTWARPDLTYLAGAPYFGQPLEAMTTDLHNAYAGAAAANNKITGVMPVGDAFMRAVQDGVAMRNPYAPTPGTVDLWWHEDQFHPSKYGAYLSALVHFAGITGKNPLVLGAGERAASDLGIEPDVAVKLQRVAQLTLGRDATPPVLSLPASFAVDATSAAGAQVNYVATASDDFPGTPTIACTPATGSIFPIGDDAVACTATDAAGNASTGSFVITVRGAADQAGALAAMVAGLAGTVNPGVVTSLTQQIERSIAAVAPESCAEFAKLEQHVAKLPGKVLAPESAAALLAASQRIRAVQGC
jgi:HYR domain-containing protein